MLLLKRALLVALYIGLATAVAWADRPHQRRDEANVVVTGEVRAVYARQSQYNRHYVVEIFIFEVERGAGFRSGETLSVVCYQPKPVRGNETEEELRERSVNVDGGHSRVPAEGDQIRAFVRHFNGTLYEGVFPDWVDVTKKAEPAAQADEGAASPATKPAGLNATVLWAAGALLMGLVVGFAAARLRRTAALE
jgi:hypothetical protein